MTYELDEWELVKLFCLVIARYEDISISKFDDPDFIVEKLEKYTQFTQDHYSDLTLQVFGTKSVGGDKTAVRNTKVLYDVADSIRYRSSYQWQQKAFQAVLEYINPKETSTPHHISYKKVEAPTFKPDPKLKDFVGTRWLFYNGIYSGHVDSYRHENFKGILKSILSLKTFAAAELSSMQSEHSDRLLQQKGRYAVCGSESQYLLITLDADISTGIKKQMWFYIGRDEIDFAIGNFEDVQVIIETTEGTRKRHKPGFYPYVEDDGNSEIRMALWNYFKTKYKFSMPITSKESFDFCMDSPSGAEPQEILAKRYIDPAILERIEGHSATSVEEDITRILRGFGIGPRYKYVFRPTSDKSIKYYNYIYEAEPIQKNEITRKQSNPTLSLFEWIKERLPTNWDFSSYKALFE